MIKKTNQLDFQYDYRVNNELRIISTLQNGRTTVANLSSKLNLSFKSILNIVNELTKNNILRKVTDIKANPGKGRAPNFVELNENLGVTCSIDFSSINIAITLNDLKLKVIDKKVLTNTFFINSKVLDKIIELIKEMLQSKNVNGRKLLEICIACPGLINKNTDKVINSFRYNYQEVPSPSDYFTKEFNVPVHTYNDVKIALLGEMVYGCIPENAQNYIFIHIGNSVGTALAFNGKLYSGSLGFSGEFTNEKLAKINVGVEKNRIHGLHYLGEYLLKKHNLSIQDDKFRVNLAKAQKLFSENNKEFNDALLMLARQNASQIVAYNDFLDLDHIIIDGSINLFIDRYKQYLEESVKEYSNQFRAKLMFSSLNGEATLLGAIYQANRLFFLSYLGKLAKEQTNNKSYNIYESFGDNIK